MSPELLGCQFDPALVAVKQRQGSALPREQLRGDPADAGGGTGDDDAAAFQPVGGGNFRSKCPHSDFIHRSQPFGEEFVDALAWSALQHHGVRGNAGGREVGEAGRDQQRVAKSHLLLLVGLHGRPEASPWTV